MLPQTHIIYCAFGDNYMLSSDFLQHSYNLIRYKPFGFKKSICDDKFNVIV